MMVSDQMVLVRLTEYQVAALAAAVYQWQSARGQEIQVAERSLDCDVLLHALQAEHLDADHADKLIEFADEFNGLTGASDEELDDLGVGNTDRYRKPEFGNRC